MVTPIEWPPCNFDAIYEKASSRLKTCQQRAEGYAIDTGVNQDIMLSQSVVGGLPSSCEVIPVLLTEASTRTDKSGEREIALAPIIATRVLYVTKTMWLEKDSPRLPRERISLRDPGLFQCVGTVSGEYIVWLCTVLWFMRQ